VVSGYALAFGLALVPAGRLGDWYGYKRLFLIGLSLFTLASVGCGVSQNSGELIIARLVQGLGAGIYYPAISAIIQRLFTGKDRSRAFGYLGGIVGVSTAAGPLLGGVLVQLAGVTDGWRWVFLVNLFIGIVALPVAFRLLPSRHDKEEHRLDHAGNLLLAAVLLLILVPLIEGRVSGWPAWSWLLLGLAVPAAAALVTWELRLEHRGGEPVVQVGLLRERRAFGTGQALALLYFAGFTSLFFTLSILWQEGLGHSALQTGLLVVPFAAGSMLTASNSYRFSRRFGRSDGPACFEFTVGVRRPVQREPGVDLRCQFSAGSRRERLLGVVALLRVGRVDDRAQRAGQRQAAPSDVLDIECGPGAERIRA
jgi:MFS family permease